MDIEQFKINVYMIEAVNNKPVNEITISNLKFLLDKSIIKTFGIFIASKLEYNLKLIDKGIFNIEYHRKDKHLILTSIVLISDLEYKIRIKLDQNDISNNNTQMEIIK